MEQISMFEMHKDNTKENQKRRWLRHLQKKCDEYAQDATTARGKCGYMAFCDYCKDSGQKSHCEKAMRAYIRETGIDYIDYSDLGSVEDWF